MLRLILSRLIQLPVILAVVFAVTLTLAWVIPGNPLERTDALRPSPEVEQAMLRQYNLHNPWAFAYSYVKNVVTQGDFGPSLQHQDQKVWDIISQGLPYSASLGALALVLAVIIGVTTAVIGALRPRSILDAGSISIALLGVSMPSFVTAAVLVTFTTVTLNWYTIQGWDWPTWPFGDQTSAAYDDGGYSGDDSEYGGDSGGEYDSDYDDGMYSDDSDAAADADWFNDMFPDEEPAEPASLGDRLKQFASECWAMFTGMITPALALSLAPAAYIARLLRMQLAETMSADFIRTARAKGRSHTGALFGHGLKVAFLPVLSYLGPAAATVMTGSFVVEHVFNIAGMGEHFVNAVLNKDQFLILGVVLTYSTILVLFNLLVDVAYAWVDPRIELAQ